MHTLFTGLLIPRAMLEPGKYFYSRSSEKQLTKGQQIQILTKMKNSTPLNNYMCITSMK